MAFKVHQVSLVSQVDAEKQDLQVNQVHVVSKDQKVPPDPLVKWVSPVRWALVVIKVPKVSPVITVFPVKTEERVKEVKLSIFESI